MSEDIKSAIRVGHPNSMAKTKNRNGKKKMKRAPKRTGRK